MLPRNGGQCVDPVLALVETGQEMELPPACFEEGSPAFDADLLERFQAVGDESGADDVHATDPLLRILRERGRGVGLEPRGSPEPRLECRLPLWLGKAEALGDEAR